TSCTHAARRRSESPRMQLPSSSAYFEANQGQADAAVRFLLRGPSYALFLTPSEAVIAPACDHDPASAASPSRVVRMKIAEPSRTVQLAGLEPLPHAVHYFVGEDPSKWHRRVPTYARVRYADVQPGIDLVFYVNGTKVEFDVVVAPGSDPSAV